MKSLEEQVVALLSEYKMKITTVESCTGGLLSGRLVNVAGVSDVFHEGYITYSNEAKERLVGVKKETLQTYGAVSEETAREMAHGAAKVAKADVALSVTGIAGPAGASEEKPVGLVYIGCYLQGTTVVKKCNFTGNRMENRQMSVDTALKLLIDELMKKKK